MTDDHMLGYWWFPEAPDTRFPGALRGAETDNPTLELILPIILEWDNFHVLILGIANGHRYSLINNGFLREKNNMASAISKSISYRIENVIRGGHFEQHDETFAKLSFSVEGIQEWSQLTGLRKSLVQRGDNPQIEHQIERVQPDSIKFHADALSIEITSTYSDSGRKWGVTILEDSQIVVTTSEPKTLMQWRDDVITPLQRLIQFAVKDGGTIRRVAVRPLADLNEDEQDPRIWLRWQARWMKPYPYDEKRLRFERPLFTAQALHGVSHCLQVWFDFYQKYDEALRALLDLHLVSRPANDKFFTTARTLERLCERFPSSVLLSKEVLDEIKRRVDDLLDDSNRSEVHGKLNGARRSTARAPLLSMLRDWQPYIEPLASTPGMIDWLAGRILDTRNCFAHHDPKTCKRAAEDEELYYLRMLVRTIVDAEICKSLGFPSDSAIAALRDSSQYRRGELLKHFFEESIVHETST